MKPFFVRMKKKMDAGARCKGVRMKEQVRLWLEVQ